MENGLSRRSSSRRQAEPATCKASESDEPRLRLCRITCVQTVRPPLRLSVHLDHCGDGETYPRRDDGPDGLHRVCRYSNTGARRRDKSTRAGITRWQAARGYPQKPTSLALPVMSVLCRYCCKSRKSNDPKNLAKVDLQTSPLLRRFQRHYGGL
jgi:hypothetical protein